MHLHILGICGTFMGGVARLAIEKGYKVTGSDQNCYPPMSDQLAELGVSLEQGYDTSILKQEPDCVVVGNALSRGNYFVEEMLNTNQQYCSGPQWLKENILQDKWVIAVAGTHGKTTTSSMIAWILEATGYNPGFLIGGVLGNFGVSARYTDSPFFVVEADEYDTAFFDKRSKFVHYRARTCVLNNLEFDHADIFDDLAAIETQFHHLVRTIPQNGLLIRPADSSALDRVINKGSWTPVETFCSQTTEESDWNITKQKTDGSLCDVYLNQQKEGCLDWSLIGDHNVNNALAAIAAVRHVGVKTEDALQALSTFTNAKRRMELRGKESGVTVYDDFAHHPTAISSTIEGLRNKVGSERVIAVVDPRSNTMRMGCHKNTLLDSVDKADFTLFHIPESFEWLLDTQGKENIVVVPSVELILQKLSQILKPGDHVLIMSNGSFEGIHQKLLDNLAKQ
ncbi:MAG: UDP-N-acetylmuramate:L-alanyl-gamma-D-glutamyl-meso-diaminopimelate ligase [Kangiellaceae bacterium]|nr:UDP-N-acetylmuramate:L-alanyl-gamma-D-glutamyl-meso-diaminopimelate ligase [Kangiellaceae bacterium]